MGLFDVEEKRMPNDSFKQIKFRGRDALFTSEEVSEGDYPVATSIYYVEYIAFDAIFLPYCIQVLDVPAKLFGCIILDTPIDDNGRALTFSQLTVDEAKELYYTKKSKDKIPDIVQLWIKSKKYDEMIRASF